MLKLHAGFKTVSNVQLRKVCSGCVASCQSLCGPCAAESWLCAGQGLQPCTRHRMQCEECLSILEMSLLVGSLPPEPTLLLPKPQWSKAQGVSHRVLLLCSHALHGGNWYQSSDRFSALGTLLLGNRVANAHTQGDCPFQAWRWKMLKKMCSYAVSAFNTTFSVVLWPFISTRSILGEIRTNPQSPHGKKNSFVVWRSSYDKITEVPLLQD